MNIFDSQSPSQMTRIYTYVLYNMLFASLNTWISTLLVHLLDFHDVLAISHYTLLENNIHTFVYVYIILTNTSISDFRDVVQIF